MSAAAASGALRGGRPQDGSGCDPAVRLAAPRGWPSQLRPARRGPAQSPPAALPRTIGCAPRSQRHAQAARPRARWPCSVLALPGGVAVAAPLVRSCSPAAGHGRAPPAAPAPPSNVKLINEPVSPQTIRSQPASRRHASTVRCGARDRLRAPHANRAAAVLFCHLHHHPRLARHVPACPRPRRRSAPPASTCSLPPSRQRDRLGLVHRFN